MNFNLSNYDKYFFIGIAGDGMSAIALYLSGMGKSVSGSDRNFKINNKTKRQKLLEDKNINCFPQDTSGLSDNIDVVVVSTAIEKTVEEYQKAEKLNLPIISRSDLLAAISRTKKTIAVSGTSGKSTVTAMTFHILEQAGYMPSLITGAGLVSLQKQGSIGNAVYGNGEYLVIEADESDGSLVKYKPEIGLILNIDKDHKELDELEEIFSVFKSNIKTKLLVNRDNERSKSFSQNKNNDFSFEEHCGFVGSDFKQEGFNINFKINGVLFKSSQLGLHNAYNIAAATAACHQVGISLEVAAQAIENYEGIYRRHQIAGIVNGVTIIDDYAHNPAKLSASIKACQFNNSRLFIWFQPHGYTPTRFLRNEFVREISESLRENDEIIMSEIYYAGGSVSKDISANDLILEIKEAGKNAFFIEDRKYLPNFLKSKVKDNDIILLTGARDPSLNEFAKYVIDNLS